VILVGDVLYHCVNCGHTGFVSLCPACGEAFRDANVPLDPQYYPEFQYESQGVVKDFLQKKKTESALRQKLDAVLEKYRQFESPYFVNYTHLTSQGEARVPQLVGTRGWFWRWFGSTMRRWCGAAGECVGTNRVA
jgi:hypothetical protein